MLNRIRRRCIMSTSSKNNRKTRQSFPPQKGGFFLTLILTLMTLHNDGQSALCSQNFLQQKNRNPLQDAGFVELMTGFEPVTSSLPSIDSKF